MLSLKDKTIFNSAFVDKKIASKSNSSLMCGIIILKNCDLKLNI